MAGISKIDLSKRAYQRQRDRSIENSAPAYPTCSIANFKGCSISQRLADGVEG